MTGAVYCPLSPRDPQQRLQALIEQIHSRLVLLHGMTLDKFKDADHAASTLVDIDLVLSWDDPNVSLINEIDLDRLSSVSVNPDSIACVIFTSGSTGPPKAVTMHHYLIRSSITMFCTCLGSIATSKFRRMHTFTT